MKNNKKIKRILLAGLFVTVLGASFAVYNSKNSAFAGGKMIKFHGMKMSKDAIKGKDIMILSAQKWLNEQYKDVDGYGEVEETGKVSEDTINGLIRGLQVELGITELANNFGPSTSQKFSEQFNELSKESEQSNAVKILQFALYCKGYRTNKEVKGKFGNGTERAVKQLQHNIGLEETGKVDVKLFRDAILSTKSFLLSNGKGKNKGDDKVREIQKAINNKCYPYEKFKLLRCDGIRDGDTAKGLIFLIQAEENMALEDANGYFGPGTTSSFPELSKGSDKENFVKILQYSLYWYGYNKSGRFDGKFDNKLANEVSEYQKFMCLPKDDGVVDAGTMKSLLLSCGDNERKTDACDTAKPLEEKDVKKLKEEGYKYVGRYLNLHHVLFLPQKLSFLCLNAFLHQHF